MGVIQYDTCLSRTSLNVIISKSIYVTANGIISFFLWLSTVPLCYANAGSIPGLGKSPGEGSGNPLQYSCLENPMDGRAWWAAVHGVAESDAPEVTEPAVFHVLYVPRRLYPLAFWWT